MKSKQMSRRELLKLGGIGLGVVALAACQPRTGVDPAPPEEVVAEVDIAVPADQTVTIWYWAGGGEHRRNFYNTEVIPLFRDEYPNIEVEIGEVGSWMDLYNKLMVGAAAGEVPELCRQKDYYMPDFAERGIMEVLDPYYDATPSLQEEGKFYHLAWDISHWKGKLMALPPNIFIHYPHMSVKLFEDAGLLEPNGCPPAFDTWEELREAAAKISELGEGIFGCMPRSEGVSEDTVNWFHVMLTMAGGRLHNEDFTEFTFNSPEGLDTLKFIVGMYEDGINKPVGVSPPDMITTDQLGIWWYAGNYWRTWPENFPDFRWGTCINPMRQTRGSVLRSNHLALFSEARQKEAAWAFMEFHMRPDIDYAYGVSQCFVTAQPANWTRPFYSGIYGDNDCALWQTEFDQLASPDNQAQPSFPGYVEGGFLIAAQLQRAYMMEISPEEALDIAEREANEVLKETIETLGM